MITLVEFREAVRAHRRAVGRSQQQLAGAIGVNAQVLSRKLNGSDGAVLTSPEVVNIVAALAGWGALADRRAAEALFDAAGVGLHSVPLEVWDEPPLSTLPAPPRSTSALHRDPAPRRLEAVPLPAPRTSLVGRDRERREVAEALGGARLVTLTGVSGTGKTRLALQVASDLADRFRDGVAFVDLAPVRDPTLLASAVAAACGLGQGGSAGSESVVVDGLRDRQLLLVLDNVEQLVEGVPVLGRLLAAAAGLRILATSRVTLHLYGEQVVRVPPLDLGDDAANGDSEAVRLFLDRARASDRHLLLDAEALSAVRHICTALDGLPLAIELAAAQTRFYPPQQLLPLLGSRFSVLRGGPRDVPDRQQTLLAALDWSHALLSPPARDLLARLGVFAGRFDASAAAAAAGAADAADLLPLLTELVEHSLVEVDATAELPFVIFQTVREYALARLAESGEEDATHRRSLRHHLELASAMKATEGAPGYARAEASIERMYPNIRVCLDFACRRGADDADCLDEGLRLATTITRMWIHRGLLGEGLHVLDRLLAVDPEGERASTAIRAAALLETCGFACFTGDYGGALVRGRATVQLAHRIGDHATAGRAYRYVGEAHYSLGQLTEAERELRKALTSCQHAGDLAGEAASLNMLGQLHRRQGHLEDAAADLRHAISLFEGLQEGHALAAITHSLAEVERDEGDLDGASDLFAESLRTSAAIVDKRTIAYALEGLAGIAELRNQPRRALVLIGAAQRQRAAIGAPLPSGEQAEVDAVLARAGSRLSPSDRDAALTAGRDRPIAEVLPEALSA